MKLLDKYRPSRLGTEAGEGRSQLRPLNRQLKTLFSTLTVLNNHLLGNTDFRCTEQDVSLCTAVCRLCDLSTSV